MLIIDRFLAVVEKHRQLQQQQHPPRGTETGHRPQHAVRRTTTMTTLSLPPASPQPPIIVLHEAPVIPPVNRDDQLPAVTSRHLRRSRRYSTATSAASQMSPEVLLAPGVLETLLINNGNLDVNSSSRSRSGILASISASAENSRAHRTGRASMTTLHH